MSFVSSGGDGRRGASTIEREADEGEPGVGSPSPHRPRVWHGRTASRYARGVSRGYQVAAALAAVTACSLTTDLKGLSSSGGPGDGGAPEGGGAVVTGDGSTVGTFDAGPDASPGEVLATGGVVIAEGASSYAAGAAQQHHVHFAQNLGAYVVFFLSTRAKNVISTRLTPDFVRFVDGPTIPLPRNHDGEGRNLDVAYANVGGADVFHVVLAIHDGDRYSYRTRGRGKDGVLTFDAPVELGRDGFKADTLDPDGASVAVLGSGRVAITSGANGVNGHTANSVVFLSNTPDDGSTTWDRAFGAGVEVEVESESVNAHSVVATPTGASMIWERADHEPTPTGLSISFFDGTKWGAPAVVGFSSGRFDIADWGQVVTSDGRVHVLRFENGAYAYRSFATGVEQAGPPPPPAAHQVGGGLVVLGQAAVPSAFALNAATQTVDRTSLEGDHWTAWKPITSTDPGRTHLSGSGDVVMWQAGDRLVGQRLSP